MKAIDIGARMAQMRTNDINSMLSEREPLEFKIRKFQIAGQRIAEFHELSYEEKIEEFKKGITCLKEQYRQYMEDFSPKPRIEYEYREFKDFNFRYEIPGDRLNFTNVLDGQGEWQIVSIPDYRGPWGKWTGFYRTSFEIVGGKKTDKRLILWFESVDYICNIYLNGRFIGSHEGFFSSFSFDVTDAILYSGSNILVVEVKNDAPIVGGVVLDNNDEIDGDKIFASTGVGWDNPADGWHNAAIPPGAGITGRVLLEERPVLFVESLYPKPDIDHSLIEAWVEVHNTENCNRSFEMMLSVHPVNFRGESVEDIACLVEPAGPGRNYYRFSLELPGFMLWSTEAPLLYSLHAVIKMDGQVIDEKKCRFGMRKFNMDTDNEPKGTLYLNNEPVILRGANETGHMQLCAMRDNINGIIDDILIAKYANMNFLRFTQRPVQSIVLSYCDMLGLMNQIDLPIFGLLRRNQFCEAVRQVQEMERHIRSHPSVIMVTYMNEAYNVAEQKKGHRHLYRNELEDFFEAATKAVRLENPDRVVKNIEGDYDPPTREGLPDFHCYNMWYTNHALPIGKLHKGFLPAFLKGWKVGCGEYGTEGLDSTEVMMRYYPREWIPESLGDDWNPEKIVKSQTYSMHGDWFEEKKDIRGWTEESREHQALATKMMTDAFRRRSDWIISTAVFSFIECWPSGWMKTLVDHTIRPKPSYFELKSSYESIRINLRTDCFKVYCGEKTGIEAWVLNDTNRRLDKLKITAAVRSDSGNHGFFEISADADPLAPSYAGTVSFDVPDTDERTKLFVDAALIDEKGMLVNKERLVLEAFKKMQSPSGLIAAHTGDISARILDKLEIACKPLEDINCKPDAIAVGSVSDFQKYSGRILELVNMGSKAVLFLEGAEGSIYSGCINFSVKKMNGVFFLARDEASIYTRSFYPKDFFMMYNDDSDCIEWIADRYIDGPRIVPFLYSYQKPDFHKQIKGPKIKLPVAGYISYGCGKLFLCTQRVENFCGKNPVLDRLIINMLTDTARA